MSKIEHLQAEIERLRKAIRDCLECANGRETEWGERAEKAFSFLHDAMEHTDANQGFAGVVGTFENQDKYVVQGDDCHEADRISKKWMWLRDWCEKNGVRLFTEETWSRAEAAYNEDRENKELEQAWTRLNS
jgi:hypothetical protein